MKGGKKGRGPNKAKGASEGSAISLHGPGNDLLFCLVLICNEIGVFIIVTFIHYQPTTFPFSRLLRIQCFSLRLT